MSEVAEQLLSTGRNVLDLMTIVGVGYGLIIVVLSTFVVQPPVHRTRPEKIATDVKPAAFLKSPVFQKLFIGIFLGTFAGLLVIGSLKTNWRTSGCNHRTSASGCIGICRGQLRRPAYLGDS